MMNALIMPLLFLAMLAFVAGAEKGCDWYWGRKRRIATAPAGLRNDGKRRRIPRGARNDRAASDRPYGKEKRYAER